MEKFFNFMFNNFGKIWIASAVIGLVLTAVAVWAVIRLVLHFT